MGRYEDRATIPSETFYLTTAIAYLNGPPHVGHAYEFATADVIYRYHEMVGRDAKFVTGSDEHGQKVDNTAARHGVTPQEWVDRTVEHFYKLNKALNLGTHTYIRTTDAHHVKFAQWMWTRCAQRGDIYMGSYKGWYNVKEETFVTDREAEAHNFKCPDTGIAYEQRDEEAYFFKLSKYHDRVEQLLKSDSFVQPESRRNELIQRLAKAPLEDLCVSRSTMSWGIPVPGDDKHVMYVWFDALSNYMSAIHYDDPAAAERKYWPANCHLIGKDIIWFHCVIWPAMLMSAELPLPRCVYGHGFVQAADGAKMSKTLQNVVNPLEALNEVSSDTFRYYLTREGHYGQDIRFSIPALIDMHNSDLCCVIGNLVHRVLALAVKSCDGVVPAVAPHSAVVDVPTLFNKAEELMSQYVLEEYATLGLDICKDVNKYLTEQAPWKLKEAAEPAEKATDGAQSVTEKKQSIIRAAMEAVYIAAHLLYPVIPAAAGEIFARFNHPMKHLCELETYNLEQGRQLKPVAEVLFTQLKAD